LFSKMAELKRDISNIKRELSLINKDKEEAFSKNHEIGKLIRSYIGQIKDFRNKRDLLTKEIRGLKDKRKASNRKLKEKIDELNKLKIEKVKVLKDLNFKENPYKLKKEIERLELSIQIEGMPFSKEQKLMKKIKEMQKSYNESRVVIDINSKIKEIMRELDSIRKEGNENHELIQEKAKQSQEEHEKMIKLSKEVDELAAKEEEHYNKFIEQKKRFNEANGNLKQRLEELRLVEERIYNMRNEQIARRVEHETNILRSKEEIVEEKIRKRQKLTTEDILLLQRKDSEDF